jgi:hypothetical protein
MSLMVAQQNSVCQNAFAADFQRFHLTIEALPVLRFS